MRGRDPHIHVASPLKVGWPGESPAMTAFLFIFHHSLAWVRA
jgi:hypothetical protein